MIHFNKITKRFKTDFWATSFTALDQVSFSIAPEQITGFLGANGAGKTTLIKILMGFIQCDEGDIQFSPQLGKTREEIFNQLGFLPERPYFYPNLTGREFILYLGRLNNLKKAMILDRLHYWSQRFFIDHALDRAIKTYSKGMMQRLGFISSLIHEPKLIILDEPLSGLDPVGRKEIKDAMLEIHRQGKSIFFSSHIVPDVEQICQKVVFLNKGKLIYDGAIDPLIYDEFKPEFFVSISGVHDLHLQTPCLSITKFNNNTIIEVSHHEKETILKELLERHYAIEMVQKKRRSLEEVFYHLKGQQYDV